MCLKKFLKGGFMPNFYLFIYLSVNAFKSFKKNHHHVAGFLDSKVSFIPSTHKKFQRKKMDAHMASNLNVMFGQNRRKENKR